MSIEGLSKANWSKLNFQSVLKVDELDLKRMDSLENLSELLPNLEAIKSAIGLFGNRHLNDISLIDDFDIPIGNDNLYSTYSNDPNGDSFDIYKDLKIAIIDNEILSNCNSDFLCKAMVEYPLLIEINENKPSCLKETIINYCNLSNTTELFKKSATVWPNPSNGIIHLSSDQDVDLIRVIDCNGNIVKESSFNSTIDISEFEDGIYFLQLFYGLTYKSIKFIKQ